MVVERPDHHCGDDLVDLLLLSFSNPDGTIRTSRTKEIVPTHSSKIIATLRCLQVSEDLEVVDTGTTGEWRIVAQVEMVTSSGGDMIQTEPPMMIEG